MLFNSSLIILAHMHSYEECLQILNESDFLLLFCCITDNLHLCKQIFVLRSESSAIYSTNASLLKLLTVLFASLSMAKVSK